MLSHTNIIIRLKPRNYNVKSGEFSTKFDYCFFRKKVYNSR